MSKVRVAAFSISLDGFGAGPRQDLNHPLGVRGFELHGWFLDTEEFKKMHGQSGGTYHPGGDVLRRSPFCTVRSASRKARTSSAATA